MYSVILRVDLEISLGMGADRADLRRGGAHHDVPEIPAFPDLDLLKTSWASTFRSRAR